MGRTSARPLVTAAPAAITSAVAATATPVRWGRRYPIVMKRPYRDRQTSSHSHSHIQTREFPQLMSPIGNIEQFSERHVVCV